MNFRSPKLLLPFLVFVALPSAPLHAQAPSQSSSSTPKHTRQPADPVLDPGSVTDGIYRNKSLALTCKIPAGWVLRTDEMNAHQEEEKQEEAKQEDATPAPPAAPSDAGGKVLLAAFSRPPLAKAEDVNSSILIAAEATAAYPGLKEPAQYFEPLTGAATAQGFTVDEAPYEFSMGTKTLVRGDFHKDVGTRKMLQSSLVMLTHGYAISITIIGGTEDEVEELIDTLTFTPNPK